MTKSNQSTIDKETDDKLASLETSFHANKDKVVQSLLNRLLLVEPELHPNLKKQ